MGKHDRSKIREHRKSRQKKRDAAKKHAEEVKKERRQRS